MNLYRYVGNESCTPPNLALGDLVIKITKPHGSKLSWFKSTHNQEKHALYNDEVVQLTFIDLWKLKRNNEYL